MEKELNKEFDKILKSYQMEIYKKNIIIKQLQDSIYIEQTIKNKLLSKL